MIQDFLIYQASSEYLYSEIDSEAVILDINSGTYYGLNEIGNQIWQWIQTPKTESQLLEYLLKEYEVSREVAKADVRALLQDMLNNGLITTRASQEIS